jgi:hypothetical protein
MLSDTSIRKEKGGGILINEQSRLTCEVQLSSHLDSVKKGKTLFQGACGIGWEEPMVRRKIYCG